VTKCNQCGMMNAAGIMNCQSCGTLLSGVVDGGVFPRATSQEQPELPAWLESLRAGERSVAPTHTGKNFSASDFIEEDSSVPSWMRAERNEARDNTGVHATFSSRQSSPSQFRPEDSNSPSGIPVRSLVDEQSLPSWVRDGEKFGSSTALPGEVAGQDKISASSLVQPDNMPSWMKSLQQDPSSFSSGIRESEKPVALPYPTIPPSSDVAHSMSTKSLPARDLIDPASLPSWMTQLGEENAHLPPGRNQSLSARETSSSFVAPSSQASSPSISMSVPSGSFDGQAGFSARNLIDPQSLPSWMVQQEQGSSQARQQPQSPRDEPVQLAGSPSQPVQPTAGEPYRSLDQLPPGQTFSASSLLDIDSLPSWLRESGQAEQASGRSPTGQPSSQPLQKSPSTSHGNGLSASSLIDMDSVPGWLHQVDQSQKNNPSVSYNQASPTKMSDAAQPGIVSGPSRGESMRVPNRPRAEINPNESESAASTLASMLGVASSVPNFSVSAPPSSPASVSGSAGGNPVLSQSLHPTSHSPSGPGSYGWSGVGAVPHTPSMAGGAVQGGYQPVLGYGNSYQEGMNNASIGNVTPAPSPYGADSSLNAARSAKAQKQTKKRGLFGAIYEWLTR
jgi:hypothetical protein